MSNQRGPWGRGDLEWHGKRGIDTSYCCTKIGIDQCYVVRLDDANAGQEMPFSMHLVVQIVIYIIP